MINQSNGVSMSDSMKTTVTQARNRITLTTNRVSTITIIPATCSRIELKDLLFHSNSSMILPDAPGIESEEQESVSAGNFEKLEVLKKYHPDSFERFKNLVPEDIEKSSIGSYDTFNIICSLFNLVNKKKITSVLIAGHSDSDDSDYDSFQISNLRCQNVCYLLQNKKDEWVQNTFEHSKVEDCQHILKFFSEKMSWNCDPGEINNNNNSETKEAVKAFKEAFSANYSGIQINDSIDEELWGAVFVLYQQQIQLYLNCNEIEVNQNVIDRLEIIVCGDKFPIEDDKKEDYSSESNKRIEILLFEEGDEPGVLTCIDSSTGFCKGECTVDTCAIYNPGYYNHIPVVPETIPDISQKNSSNGNFKIEASYSNKKQYLSEEAHGKKYQIQYKKVESDPNDLWNYLDNYDEQMETPPMKDFNLNES